MFYFSPQKVYSVSSSCNFNNIPVADANLQKHLGIQLAKKLNFEEHLSKVESMVHKTIGIIGQFQNVHPRSALLQLLSYKHCLIRCSTVMNFLTSRMSSLPPSSISD